MSSSTQAFTLPSGAKLVVTKANITDAEALHDAVLGALRGAFIIPANVADIDINLGQILGNPAFLGSAIDKVLALASSKDVRAAAFKCAERATYEGVRVTRDLFDDPALGEKSRKDYYFILGRVIEVNLLDFFEQTFSWLKGLTVRGSGAAQK